MKILHVANFSLLKKDAVFYSMDKKISNGLTRNGHLVCDFSYRDISKIYRLFGFKKIGINKMIKSLFSSINNIQPDLILLGHTELIDGEVLFLIRKQYPNIKIAMWWVDWLKNLSSIKSKIQFIDVLFTTTGIKDFPKINFENKNLKISYLPNMCDSSIESYKAFDEVNFDRELFFAGRLDKERESFIINLKKSLKDIRFDIFGNTKDSVLLGNKFLQTISKSKISLNLSRDHETSLYSSDRLIQLISNGSMVISRKIPDIEILFNHNEIIFFDNEEDCLEKINYYLSNNEERKKIAKNGWKKSHSSYNSTRVTKFMLEAIFQETYTEDYEWKNQIIQFE
jgi:glycosyltransferase involved in cell wall biosynthesis